ncbi:MAG: DUF434 domain-containing protein [Desulfosoma sp.]|uniref:DUF434 domain-containing protein n=1 Tax=Desulfosoma sp. TaxID=2603217 RepID=UPI00404ABA7F
MARPSPAASDEPIYQAARDFLWLQDRGYPREAALHWVGNRFALVRSERDLLRRGVFSQRSAAQRLAKRVRGALWRHRPLWVDGHNVHITVESLLLKRPMVLANDGALRDVAALSGSYHMSEVTEPAIKAIFSFLEAFPSVEVYFLFDAPMSRSGELAAQYRKSLQKHGLLGEAWAVPVPEKHFPTSKAVIASSDHAVVESSTHWLDLARGVMDFMSLPFCGYDFRGLAAI